MAEAHVYVRVQIASVSNADARAVETAVTALQTAVEDAGGEWKGGTQVVLDPVASARGAEVSTQSGAAIVNKSKAVPAATVAAAKTAVTSNGTPKGKKSKGKVK